MRPIDVLIYLVHYLFVCTDDDLFPNIIGNSVNFMAGALIEIGFGSISSSMPALNHILVTAAPRSLELWLGKSCLNKWLSGGSGSSSRKKSFKESFRYAPGTKLGNNRNIGPFDGSLDETHEHSVYLDKYQAEEAFHPHIHQDLKSDVGNILIICKVEGR